MRGEDNCEQVGSLERCHVHPEANALQQAWSFFEYDRTLTHGKILASWPGMVDDFLAQMTVSLPPECCTLFHPQHLRTRPDMSVIHYMPRVGLEFCALAPKCY